MMMKEIKIQNFKCFTDFEASSFKRVNLITGANNSGKTALLEAIYLLYATKNQISFITTFSNIIKNRMTDFEDLINGISPNIVKINSENKSISYKTNEIDDGIEINIDDKKQPLISWDSYFSKISRVMPASYNDSNIVFLPSKTIFPTELTNLYSVVQRNKKNKEMIEFLSKIDNRIKEIEVSADSKVIILDVEGIDKMINASELGEGTNRFIALFSTLLKAKNGILLIDEIENGIHYTKLPTLWDLILDISKKLNIQVFVTTHDDDAIDALYNAAYRSDEKDIAMYFMAKREYNNISRESISYEIIQDSVNNGGNLRGW